MEGPGQGRPVKPRSKDSSSGRWTIMVMGRVGKVRSFKVSPRVLLWTFLFLLIYLPLSVLVVNQWVELRRETKTRKETIDRLELELAKAERTLFKFRQHVTLLETYLESLESGRERKAEVAAETVEPEPVAEEGAPAPQAEVAAEAEAAAVTEVTEAAEAAEKPEPELRDLVDVQRMTIEPEGGAVRVSFNLMNTTVGEEPVSGYVHILASGDANGSPWWQVYPRGTVSENGIPESYRMGQPFIIQRFKPIQGRFVAGQGRGLPDAIRVVVYDDAGRLIYNESFEVKHAS